MKNKKDFRGIYPELVEGIPNAGIAIEKLIFTRPKKKDTTQSIINANQRLK